MLTLEKYDFHSPIKRYFFNNQKSLLSHFIILTLLYPTFITSQILYQESFDSGDWPAGWTHEGNWVITSSQNSAHEGNNTPPAAVFEWSTGGGALTDYEQSMTSAAINVGYNDTVRVRFYIALDFYDPGELNGLKVSYDGGFGWTDVLDYSIGPGLTVPDNPWTSTQTFLAIINDDSTLQIRWTAYGTNSWAIDG